MQRAFLSAWGKLVWSLFFLAHSHLCAADRCPENLPQLQFSKLPLVIKNSLGAHDLLEPLNQATVLEREVKIYEYLQAGSMPDFLRRLKPIQIQESGHDLCFWVMPDYLSIGNDVDSVLLPLSFLTVAKLLKAWDFLLPTSKMVDAIYQQADQVYWPRVYAPSQSMNSIETFIAHSDRIQAQDFGLLDKARLVAGHKKDIVLSNRLLQRSNRIAIYGWQNLSAGENIQPLSILHGERYVDYSHGVRLVAPWVWLDKQLVPLRQLLTDPILHSLLSREGPLALDAILPRLSPELAHHQ